MSPGNGIADAVFEAFDDKLPTWTLWAATGIVGVVLISIATRSAAARNAQGTHG